MTPHEKAAVLVEALPWLEKFHGATIVVKFGGNAMVNDDLMQAFADDIAFLRIAGLRPVVVHGGGPQISAELTSRGIASEFKGGLRVTTPETIDSVLKVFAGSVNTELVAALGVAGLRAVGLTGLDAALATAEQLDQIGRAHV